MNSEVQTLPQPSSKTVKIHLTNSLRDGIIVLWMLSMAFGAAGLICCGVASWEDPFFSIMYLGLGIFLVFVCVGRIVRKELEYANSKDSGKDRIRWF